MGEWHPVFDTLWERRWRLVGCLAVSVFLIGYGIFCIVTKHAYIPGRRFGGLHLYDLNAVLAGAAIMMLGLALNAHYCWSVSERLERYSATVALSGFAAFFVCIAWLLGRNIF